MKGEGWKMMVVVVDAESGTNDMFEVEKDFIWCVCVVSKL